MYKFVKGNFLFKFQNLFSLVFPCELCFSPTKKEESKFKLQITFLRCVELSFLLKGKFSWRRQNRLEQFSHFFYLSRTRIFIEIDSKSGWGYFILLLCNIFPQKDKTFFLFMIGSNKNSRRSSLDIYLLFHIHSIREKKNL